MPLLWHSEYSSSGADGQTSAAIMLAAGGFEECAVQCLWEEVGKC